MLRKEREREEFFGTWSKRVKEKQSQITLRIRKKNIQKNVNEERWKKIERK
jgi:hypothetical protein